MLDRLEGGPSSVATTLDWAIKRIVFGRFASERGFSWSDLADWTNILALLAGPLGEMGVGHRSGVLNALRHPTGAVRELMARAEPSLARAGLSWDQLDAFATLRQNLFEADVRFSALGGGGVFAALDDDGVLTHHFAGVDNIEHAIENPPAIGRARVRSQVIRRLAHERDGYACAWSHVANLAASTVLDLSDPFETTERWLPGQRSGMIGECRPLDPTGFPFGADPYAVRLEAYQSYLQGRYERAEALLRGLIRRGFEPADTHSHLARTLIMLDRLSEARVVVGTAWGLRATAPSDVIARVLWFQSYFSLIDGTDPGVSLGRLKGLLMSTEAFNSWALQPLLDRIRTTVSREAFGLLSAIFDAWSNRERLPDLEAFPAWRTAAPLDLP
jgi:hypothetical protein